MDFVAQVKPGILFFHQNTEKTWSFPLKLGLVGILAEDFRIFSA